MKPSAEKIQSSVKEYLSSELLVDFSELSLDDDLIDSGIVDSFALIEYVGFLEGEFEISISVEEVLDGVLRSVQSCVQFVSMKGGEDE